MPKNIPHPGRRGGFFYDFFKAGPKFVVETVLVFWFYLFTFALL